MDDVLLKVPIRWRLALGYTLFLVTLIGGVSAFVLTTLESNLMQEADETLAIRATHVARVIGDTGGGQIDAETASRALLDLAPLEEYSAPGLYVEVLDDEGNLLTASPNLPGGHLPGESLVMSTALSGQESYVTVPVASERVRVHARPLRSGERQVGVLLVGESLHPQAVALDRVRRLLGISALVAAAVTLLGSWWLAGRALSTIAKVTRVARRIAVTGEFEQRIEERPVRDELGDLIATFNQMLAGLERTFRHHREFLADASHELRGPLMVIRGNLDLLKRDLPALEREESAREALAEAERMSRLLSDLLFLAKSDAHLAVQRTPLDLSGVVLETLARAASLDAGRHTLVLTHNEPLAVQGNRERLLEMLWNLVQNAIRYTPDGGEITLSLRRSGPLAELAVEDTGAGIPAAHLDRIFDRFYRVDRARSREDGGTGLGLAIVRQVAESHGGRVSVRSREGNGSVFTVTIPILRT